MNPEILAELRAEITRLAEAYSTTIGESDDSSLYLRGVVNGKYIGMCTTLIKLGFLPEAKELSMIWNVVALGWENGEFFTDK
jgi:hypothetical protein